MDKNDAPGRAQKMPWLKMNMHAEHSKSCRVQYSTALGVSTVDSDVTKVTGNQPEDR